MSLVTLAAFGQLSTLADRAAEYGFLAVLAVVAGDGVFPALPGETAIVAAAVLASAGKGSLWLVIAAGAIGAVLGDSTAYWIGRAGQGPIREALSRLAGSHASRPPSGWWAATAPRSSWPADSSRAAHRDQHGVRSGAHDVPPVPRVRFARRHDLVVSGGAAGVFAARRSRTRSGWPSWWRSPSPGSSPS